MLVEHGGLAASCGRCNGHRAAIGHGRHVAAALGSRTARQAVAVSSCQAAQRRVAAADTLGQVFVRAVDVDCHWRRTCGPFGFAQRLRDQVDVNLTLPPVVGGGGSCGLLAAADGGYVLHG